MTAKMPEIGFANDRSRHTKRPASLFCAVQLRGSARRRVDAAKALGIVVWCWRHSPQAPPATPDPTRNPYCISRATDPSTVMPVAVRPRTLRDSGRRVVTPSTTVGFARSYAPPCDLQPAQRCAALRKWLPNPVEVAGAIPTWRKRWFEYRRGSPTRGAAPVQAYEGKRGAT
jgi:hypothetical protein